MGTRRRLFQRDIDEVQYVGIGCRPERIERERDKWVWKGDSLGSYTVKSTYKCLRCMEQNMTNGLLMKVWKKSVTLKVVDCVVQNKVPSLANLMRRRC